MKRLLKKGFTLVELVVVIAIIAILSGVGVAVYVGVTNKAKATADSEVITQLNLYLKTQQVEEGNNISCYDAYQDAAEIGYNLDLLTPQSGGYYVWDQEVDRFCVVKDGKLIAGEKDYKLPEVGKEYVLWKFTKTISPYEIWSQYLSSNELSGEVSVRSGFDAGRNKLITKVNYKNEGSTAKDLRFRLNSFSTQVVLEPFVSSDANNGDHIEFYGNVGKVTGPQDGTDLLGNPIYKGFKCAFKSVLLKGRFIEAKIESGHIDVSNADDTPFPVYDNEGNITSYVQWPEVCATSNDVKASNNSDNNIHFHAEADSAAEEKINADKMNSETGEKAKSGNVTWDYRENDEQNDKDVYHHVNDAGNKTADNEDKGVWTDSEVYDSDANADVIVEEKTNEEKSEQGYVAMNSVTKVYYKDADLAFCEAEDGETVVIIANVTVSKEIIPNEVEFDLNGFEISVAMHKGLRAQWGAIYWDYYIYDSAKKDYCDQNTWYYIDSSTEFYLYFDGAWHYDYYGNDLLSYVDDPFNSPYVKYDTIETYVTFSKTFNGNSTALKYFNGGYGTDDNPFEIAKPYQWNNIRTGYSITGNKCFELVDNVDFEGTAPKTSYVTGIKLYGNNKRILNASGPLFSQNWIYDGYFENFTFVDCDSYYNLFCKVGAYSIATKLEFVNIDCDSCRARNGCLFMSWVYGNYSVSFTGCDITNCVIDDTNNSQGFVGTFSGNSKSTVSVTNCKLYNVKINASQSTAGGFFGNGNGTVTNCFVDANSMFEQKGDFNLYAYGGGSINTDSKFYGTIKTISKNQAIFEGTSASTGTWIASNPIASAENFVLNDDGSISYNGSATLAKITINQKYCMNRLKNGVPYADDSGIPAYVENDGIYVFSDVATDSVIANAYRKITNIRNVGCAFEGALNYAIDELPEGLEFNDREVAIDENGVMYKDSSGSTYSDYVGSTAAGETGPVWFTVYIHIYDSSDELLTTVTIGYSVQPTM